MSRRLGRLEPSGTGLNFAQAVGIRSIDEGLEVLRNGGRHTIGREMADDHRFVNSCVG